MCANTNLSIWHQQQQKKCIFGVATQKGHLASILKKHGTISAMQFTNVSLLK